MTGVQTCALPIYKVCIRAYGERRVLVAAYKNGLYKTVKSYPAYFDEVIGVGYDIRHYEGISRNNSNLLFANNTVYIPNVQKNSIRVGSSYLTAYVSGVIASSRLNKYECILEFFTQNIGKNIYFNKYTFDFRKFFYEKKFCYLGDINNLIDIGQVRDFYLRWMQDRKSVV